MIFSAKRNSEGSSAEQASALLRILQQLLDTYAAHSVQYDLTEHAEFRSSIREIGRRFDRQPSSTDLLLIAGETNKTIQTYNHQVQKFIHDLSAEKQQAVKLLSQSLLRVCHASEKSAQTLRQIEHELGAASQLQDMRELRAKMAECVSALCLEADAQDARYRELKEQISHSDARDQVTGLGTLKSAVSRMEELSNVATQGYAMTFFLKNVDVINRRFGFAAGDDVLRRFVAYLGNHLQGNDQLFRWRGPCFLVLTDRFTSADAVQSEANIVGMRGPEQEVEGGGKSMLIRLTAATATFPIPKGQGPAELPAKIDNFAAEQYKMAAR